MIVDFLRWSKRNRMKATCKMCSFETKQTEVSVKYNKSNHSYYYRCETCNHHQRLIQLQRLKGRLVVLFFSVQKTQFSQRQQLFASLRKNNCSGIYICRFTVGTANRPFLQRSPSRRCKAISMTTIC